MDEARSVRPRTFTDGDVERVVTLTLETTPKDDTHWSTRFMARRSGLSHNTMSHIWRAFALQPLRTETFKLLAAPPLHREFAGYRGALPQPAGPGASLVGGREALNTSTEPHQAA